MTCFWSHAESQSQILEGKPQLVRGNSLVLLVFQLLAPPVAQGQDTGVQPVME